MNSEVFTHSAGFEERIAYVYRHSTAVNLAHNPVKVRHLGGNLVTEPTANLNEMGEVIAFDTASTLQELQRQAALYVGSGGLLCAHYSLSLPVGERLREAQWIFAVHIYMQEQGYGNDTKWVAVIHDDTLIDHVHIIACRVKYDRKLVDDRNDYDRGIQSVRRIEKLFELTVCPSPDENFGIEYSIADMKAGCGRGTKAASRDPAHIIRVAFDAIFQNKPQTISELVYRLREHNVMVAVYSEGGKPRGIKYSIDGMKWISGSRVKKQRVTWGKLINAGVEYVPLRDDPVLMLKNINSANSYYMRGPLGYIADKKINTAVEPFYFSVVVRCTDKQLKKMKKPSKAFSRNIGTAHKEWIIQNNYVVYPDVNSVGETKDFIKQFMRLLQDLLSSILKQTLQGVTLGLNPKIDEYFKLQQSASVDDINKVTTIIDFSLHSLKNFFQKEYECIFKLIRPSHEHDNEYTLKQ